MAGDDATILVSDETTMRMFPPLRAAWARLGEQSEVGISGHNARRTLFGAINVRTGHRIVTVAKRLTQLTFQDFIEEIRHRYRRGEIHMILDRLGAHRTASTRELARRLGIKLHLLPKQSPELNAVDHLWRHVKEHTAANRQYDTVDELASNARAWTLVLSNNAALRKAGLLAPNSWLRRFSQNLRGPT
jgi:transposase